MKRIDAGDGFGDLRKGSACWARGDLERIEDPGVPVNSNKWISFVLISYYTSE